MLHDLRYFVVNRGLVNRKTIRDPETIQDFFSAGEWEITILYIVYMVRFTAVLPELSIINR